MPLYRSYTDDFVNTTGDTMTGALGLPSNGLQVGSSQIVTGSDPNGGASVGIRTSSFGSASHAYSLAVVGNVFATRFYSTTFRAPTSGNAWVALSGASDETLQIGNNALTTVNIRAGSSGVFNFGTSTATNLSVSNSTGQVGVGITPTSKLHVADDTSVDINIQSAGVAGTRPGISSYRSSGSLASPGVTGNDSILLFFGGRGHTGNAWPSSSNGAVLIRTAQTFSPTSQGTYITFETTPINSTTRTVKVRVPADLDGFEFGTAKDTNLYRSDASVLKTDDAFDANSYSVSGSAGADGSFTTVDGKTVTVTKGLITSIV